MTRIQQRRARYVFVAATISFFIILVWLRAGDEPVTWHSPIPSSKPLGNIQDSNEPVDTQPPISPPGSEEPLPTLPAESDRTTVKDAELASVLAESAAAGSPTPTPKKECAKYERLLKSHEKNNISEGKRKFPYQRPEKECRTFQLPALEQLIERMRGVIKDPDLFRLFENSYPNTLDTMIKWRGYAAKTDPVTKNKTVTDEELSYIITGDIDAMWLRDSASQVYSYLPLLEESTDKNSLASLWRGLINSHARYIIISPYCHSFQPPIESGVNPTSNSAFSLNNPQPPYDPRLVFDCKWELDSLASFLQISTAYYERTGDLKFFQKYNWIEAVKAATNAAGAMRLGTYSKEGKVEKSAWTFTGYTNRGSETLTNDGLGNPTKGNGMVRTAFRPSDDACIYQLLVPANMMFAKYLEEASLIMAKLDGEEAKNTTTIMRELAFGIRTGIDRDAVVRHRDFGDIFAYEVDGFGSMNLMDDANIPSLLAMPLWDYAKSSFPLPKPAKGDSKRNYQKIYENTRAFALSESNPYFMRGPELSAVGGPHLGPGKGWPMAAIIRGLTAFSMGLRGKELEIEVKDQLAIVLNSTGGSGLIHESVNAWNSNDWTRAWFGWANGLLGELILKIEKEKPEWLRESWQ